MDKQENNNEQKQANGKRTLLLILFVSIAPIALAYFSFFTGIGVPSSTASYGDIINPAVNVKPLFAEQHSEFYDGLMQNKKWHLFLPVAENCNEECEQNLYVTRQVHIRLGEKSVRVERILIDLSEAGFAERMKSMKEDHPLLRGVPASKSDWLELFESKIDMADPDTKPYYLLVDQEGFAMMRYTSEIEGGDLLKDLKRALKHSIDYQ